jgi:hypothetical protein
VYETGAAWVGVIIRSLGGEASWSLGVVAGSGVTLGSLKTGSWSSTGFGLVLQCFGVVTGCCLCCHGKATALRFRIHHPQEKSVHQWSVQPSTIQQPTAGRRHS